MMQNWLSQQAQQWKEALTTPLSDFSFPRQIAQVCVIGMGGSAFGAEVVQAITSQTLRIPFVICRGYDIPAWVGPQTLVIASSYSGSTEETLIAVEKAQQKGAMIVTLSSGGILAQKASISHIPLPTGFVPRMAVFYSIGAQLRLLRKAQLIPDSLWNEIQKSPQSLEIFAEKKPSYLSLARELQNKIIVLYAVEGYESIALRARQQIQENAKHAAWHHIIPEMNHNEILGLDFPTNLAEKIAVVFIYGSHIHPRNRLRIEFLQNILQKRGIFTYTLTPPTDTYSAELVILMHMVDTLSLELADLHGVDAQGVPTIDELKAFLAQKAYS